MQLTSYSYIYCSYIYAITNILYYKALTIYSAIIVRIVAIAIASYIM